MLSLSMIELQSEAEMQLVLHLSSVLLITLLLSSEETKFRRVSTFWSG